MKGIFAKASFASLEIQPMLLDHFRKVVKCRIKMGIGGIGEQQARSPLIQKQPSHRQTGQKRVGGIFNLRSGYYHSINPRPRHIIRPPVGSDRIKQRQLKGIWIYDPLDSFLNFIGDNF